ncbi:PIN domain-containing protein [Candidatus Woesearchaeota archaeon]|nr:PIN domain-containing protein [Candidatus Woesearchaeota archaeon]
MGERYYVDTNIWLDYLENRSDRFRPLGDWALAFLNMVSETGGNILLSDLVIKELERHLSPRSIKELLEPFMESIIFVKSAKSQVSEALVLSRQRRVHFADALHAVIARAEGAILVSRDQHFMGLCDAVPIMKPEDLI